MLTSFHEIALIFVGFLQFLKQFHVNWHFPHMFVCTYPQSFHASSCQSYHDCIGPPHSVSTFLMAKLITIYIISVLFICKKLALTQFYSEIQRQDVSKYTLPSNSNVTKFIISGSVSDIKSSTYDLHDQDTVTGSTLFLFFLLNKHFIMTYHHLVEAYDEEKCTKSI